MPFALMSECYDPALSLAELIERVQPLADASCAGMLSCVRQGLLDGIAMHCTLADLGYPSAVCDQLRAITDGHVLASLRRAQMVQESSS